MMCRCCSSLLIIIVNASRVCNEDGNPGCFSCSECSQAGAVYLPDHYGTQQGFCTYQPAHSMPPVNYAAPIVAVALLVGLIGLKLFRWKCSKGFQTHTSNLGIIGEAQKSLASCDTLSETQSFSSIDCQLLEDEASKENIRLGSKPHLTHRAVKLEQQRLDDYAIRGNEYRETIVRDLVRKHYWPWELLAFWRLYGPLDFFLLLLFLAIITFFLVYVEAGITLFLMPLMLLAIIGFRVGYLVTKYFSLALETFHHLSLDDLVFGMTGSYPERFNIDSTAKSRPVNIDGVEMEGLDTSSRCETESRNRLSKTECLPFSLRRALKNAITSMFTYAPEFIQALQICLPVLTPYISHRVNNGHTVSNHSGFLVFKIPNVDVLGNVDSGIKFAIFMCGGIVMTALLSVSILLPLFLGEPWAVTILKLSRQAVETATYEITEHQVCGIRWFWIFSCIPHGLRKILDVLVRSINTSGNSSAWVKKLFFAIKKFADISFIPLIIHLVGVFIDEDMYPGLQLQFGWAIVVVFISVFLYLLYTLVYSFSAALISIQEHVDMQSSTKRGEPFLLHPRFLYKMIWARLAVIVLSTDSGHRTEWYQYFQPSNLHVRVYAVLILWWIVIAHAELLKSVWPRLQKCARCRSDLHQQNVNSANFDSSNLLNRNYTSHAGSRSLHRSLKYPTNVQSFNLRHRGALIFVALFSTLVLLDYFVTLRPVVLMCWTALIFSVVLTVTECLIMYLDL